jgi:hypothetical protein
MPSYSPNVPAYTPNFIQRGIYVGPYNIRHILNNLDNNLKFSGHLQTIYSVYGDFSKVDHVVYERSSPSTTWIPPSLLINPRICRKYLRLTDGGTLYAFLRSFPAPLSVHFEPIEV